MKRIVLALFLAFALLALAVVLTVPPDLIQAAPLRQTNTPPVADFTIDPPQGVAGTLFFFDPISSSDNEDSDAWLLVRFDFDGDGAWDTTWDNPTNPDSRHTYNAPGDYQVKLEVQDTDGLTDVKVKTLRVGDPGSNTPPNADCTGTPPSGPPGTVFTFSAAGGFDAEDAPSALVVKWDQYGSFDFRGQTWVPATQPITFTYNANGIHEVDLIVMDSGQLMDSADCQVEVVPPGGNTPPTADLVITPATGTITTTFTVDVTGSTDREDAIADMAVQFDWTDDGVYDTAWLNASQTWTYSYRNVWGQITVRARIQDSGGLTEEVTRVIQVTTPFHAHLPFIAASKP